MRLPARLLFLLLIAATFTLSACGKKGEAKKSDTQVVAVVNGDEITIHQVNFQLSRMGQMNEAQAKVASKSVLSRLIEMQLLKQQAIDQKLDKNPVLLQALESSKDQMLAQAYLETMMAKAEKPSSAEIDGFYKSHSELFENRRVFRLQELIVTIDKSKYAETEASLKSLGGINNIAIWLKDKNYPFNVNSSVKAAEQLPSDLLKKLQVLKDGEVLILPAPDALHILNISASQTVPISRVKATPIIEQYFMNQNKTNLAKKEMTALNEKAKIEFIGSFSDMKKADLTNLNTTNSADAATPLASAKADASKASVLTEKTTKPNTSTSSIDKGLSGL